MDVKPKCQQLAEIIAGMISYSDQILDGLHRDDRPLKQVAMIDLTHNFQRLSEMKVISEQTTRDINHTLEGIEYYEKPSLVEAGVRHLQKLLLAEGLVQVAACQCNPCK